MDGLRVNPAFKNKDFGLATTGIDTANTHNTKYQGKQYNGKHDGTMNDEQSNTMFETITSLNSIITEQN